jgi:hypothetical protein
MADILGKIAEGAGAYEGIKNFLGKNKSGQKARELAEQDPRIKIQEAKNISQKSTLSFPLDLGDPFFAMNFVGYSWNENSGRAGGGIRSAGSTTICLPVPRELKQTYSVEWVSEQVGPFVKELIDLANQQGIGNAGGFERALRAEFSDVTGEDVVAGARAIGTAVVKGAASKVLGALNLKTAIGLYAGVAENPNDRAMLKSVPLREHNFNWSFSPRNYDEWKRLKDIHDIIRKKMYPSRSTFLLRYPEVVDIDIVQGVQMRFFKRAAIKGFEMDMSAGGASFFQVGKTGGSAEPVIYNMALSVVELEAIDAADF